MSLAVLTPFLLAAALAHAEADGTIRSLAALDAAISDAAPRAGAFEIDGMVTSGTSDLGDQFILTDGSVHMRMTDGVFWPKLTLRAGDRIRASGRVVRQTDNTYNYAKAFDLAVISHDKPPPPVDASAAEINDGRMRNRIVRLKGTIIDLLRDEIDPRFIFLVIFSGGETVYANIRRTGNSEKLKSLVGAKVSVVGACVLSHEADTSRFNLGMLLHIGSMHDISILRPAPKDPFSAPPLEGGVRDIRKAAASDSPRRKATGRVIAVWRGDCALLRTDENHVSRIRISSGTAPAVGDVIEAVGMPETDIYNRNLSRAIWRRRGDTPPSRPTTEARDPLPPEHVAVKSLLVDEQGRTEMKPRYHGRLVRLRGIVQNASKPDGKHFSLTLNDQGADIPVELGFSGTSQPADLVGCKVEVTGICVMDAEVWRPQTPFPRILGFFIVTRTADDIKILSRPPWWTPRRLAAVIGALLATLLAVTAWNILLQKVSDRKGRELAAAKFARSVSELKVSERTRLATELHDSIVQNLTGTSMKLRAADKMFESRREESRRQLSLALKTLDSCRDELRNCIWDLRNQTLDEPVMDKVLLRVLAPHVGDASLAVRFAVPRERLTDNTAHAIICIVRELVLNAIRHGRATSIHVAGCIDGGNVLFSVKDDGCGFDVENAPGSDQGHFGLQGVRERIEALQGAMSIESEIGRGSKVCVSLRLPSTS